MMTSKVIPIRTAGSNAYLIEGEQGLVLVDTCRWKNARPVYASLERAGYKLSDIRLILLTHVHFDHVAGAASLKKASGAPIMVHALEAAMLQAGKTPLPAGANPFADWLSRMGNKFLPSIGKFAPVQADILIDGNFNLSAYGINGYVLPTPGHTTGSVSLILNEGEAIVGDCCIYAIEDFVLPPFANDLPLLLDTWHKLVNLGCRTYWPGHGKPIPHNILLSSINKLVERIRKRAGAG